MQQVFSSVPKKNPPLGAEKKLIFTSAKEDIAARFKLFSGGKIALVSDQGRFSLFRDFALSPRAICLILEDDALPLFSLPEGVCCVLAAGGRETLLAARCFAEVRRLPCAVYPSDALLAGAAEKTALLPVGGDLSSHTLAPAAVCCDEELLSPPLGEGYAALLLARLSHFESRALSEFGMGEVRPAVTLPELSFRPVFSALFALPEELKEGECFTLASLLKEDGEKTPNIRAYHELLALYAAFFLKGKPRKHFVPDYALRLQRSKSPLSAFVPTPEEYAARALALERIRGPFAAEAVRLLNERDMEEQRISALSPVNTRGDRTRLKYLPEYAPNGLSSVVRDFGLTDF